jgi:hypothetical protein
MTQDMVVASLSTLEAEAETVINQSSPQRMRTEVVLQRSGELAGRLDGITRTWTGILMRGFTGGVYVQLRNPNRAVIGVTELRSYGVDGKWVGRSDRTEAWVEQFSAAVAANTVELEIIQLHTPRDRYAQIVAEVAEKVRIAKETAIRLGLGG